VPRSLVPASYNQISITFMLLLSHNPYGIMSLVQIEGIDKPA
jgi:hypothetical protein